MDRGLGFLDSINKVFWKKKVKEEPKNNDVQVEDVSLDGLEKAESEYWARLSDHSKKKRMGSVESASEPTRNGLLEDIRLGESFPKGAESVKSSTLDENHSQGQYTTPIAKKNEYSNNAVTNFAVESLIPASAPVDKKEGLESHKVDDSPTRHQGISSDQSCREIFITERLNHSQNKDSNSCSNSIGKVLGEMQRENVIETPVLSSTCGVAQSCNSENQELHGDVKTRSNNAKTEIKDKVMETPIDRVGIEPGQSQVAKMIDPLSEGCSIKTETNTLEKRTNAVLGTTESVSKKDSIEGSSIPGINNTPEISILLKPKCESDLLPKALLPASKTSKGNVVDLTERNIDEFKTKGDTTTGLMSGSLQGVKLDENLTISNGQLNLDGRKVEANSATVGSESRTVEIKSCEKLGQASDCGNVLQNVSGNVFDISGASQVKSSEDGNADKLKAAKSVMKRNKTEGVATEKVKSERRMSEAVRLNRRSSSGTMSPDLGSRRASGTISPISELAFNSIQDKILALSRENSQADVQKKAPKIKKLDDKLLAVVKKEPLKEKPKEIVKISPKIDRNLQSKILKFGAPSAGAKIPVQPMKSVVGGLAIKEEEQSAGETSKLKKKVKQKAPLPPTNIVESEPSTPVSERKVKRPKGKAPPPPGFEKSTDKSVTENELKEEGLERNELTADNLAESANISPDPVGSSVSNHTLCKEVETKVTDAMKNSNEVTGIERNFSTKVNLNDISLAQECQKSASTCDNALSSEQVVIESSALPPKACIPKELVNGEVHTLPILVIPEINTETHIPDAILKDTVDDDKTPRPSRRQLNIGSVHIERCRESLTPEILAESVRIHEEMNLLSQRWRDSSDESFHTPSPRPVDDYPPMFSSTVEELPVMYSSRGEVIGGSRLSALPSIQTSSPERELFTPEGSPLSDFSDDSYDHYVASVDFSVRSSSQPRRVFPQNPRPWSYHEDWKEDSPVVFDARLSFDLAARATPVRQLFSPSPAHTEPNTASNSLSCKIAEFLSRTDHVMDEWKRIGRGDSHDIQSLVELPNHLSCSAKKSKSAANIMIKGFQYYSRGSSKGSWRSPSISRYSEASDRTLADLDELNEMTADLAEERASGSQSSERLEAETAERIRLEQELSQVSDRKSKLEQTVEQMELELYYAKGDVNGLSESEADWEDGRDSGVYKQKCARLMREIQMLRSRLQQQHEDDLEQLVGLKKQLEKKLADAYEEVDEQRQIVAQWKRKSQKLQAEINDLRLILEEQNSRNNLLEKKQRKFDMEIQMLQDELRSEKNLRDRVSREREVAVGEKYSLEQSLSSVRLELELKEEKLGGLSRELEELSFGGATEQDMSQLRKVKHDLEMKIKDQEDELDDLAGQVSILESAKLKLEMSLESVKKEHRKEVAQKEEEIDDVRSNAMKKLKALEAALEQEHEDRTLLLREKHELERRLKDQEERGRSNRAAEEDTLVRLRKDLRKTKALLRDANVMLDRAKQDSTSKATLRALKNQLEDSELARATAVKAKQSIESELSETNGLLEEANRSKAEAESRAQAAVRQSSTLRSQLEENEEELSELMKKYRQALQHLTLEQTKHQEAISNISEVEAERDSLREQLAEMTARLESAASVDPTTDLSQRRLETRIKDLESRLELEATVRARLEVQISRLKENLERITEESNQYRTKEQTASDQVRKIQRSLRECKEELAVHVAREQEANQKRRELEKRLEAAEQETASARNDLRLSIQRVQDLQHALSAEISSDSDLSSDTEIIEDSGLLSADSTRN